MGIPVDSNDVEAMLNLYEKTLGRLAGGPISKRAKQDAVVEIRVLFRELADVTSKTKRLPRYIPQDLDPDDQILEV